MSLKDGPGEGTWAAFAEKVVAERDEAFELLRLMWNEADRWHGERASSHFRSDISERMAKLVGGPRPATSTKGPGGRVWRRLSDDCDGNSVWTLRDDDMNDMPGVIIWDPAEAGWLPMHEGAVYAARLSEAMEQVERYLGVAGAVRPIFSGTENTAIGEANPEKPWPTISTKGPNSREKLGREVSAAVIGKVLSGEWSWAALPKRLQEACCDIGERLYQRGREDARVLQM